MGCICKTYRNWTGTWWNLYIRKFSKSLLCYQFSLNHWPLSFKFRFNNFKMIFKKNSKLVWLSSLLELEFKVLFEIENHFGIEDINKSLVGLRFHPILDIRDLFAKIKCQITFKFDSIFFLNFRLLEIDIRHIKY